MSLKAIGVENIRYTIYHLLLVLCSNKVLTISEVLPQCTWL